MMHFGYTPKPRPPAATVGAAFVALVVMSLAQIAPASEPTLPGGPTQSIPIAPEATHLATQPTSGPKQPVSPIEFWTLEPNEGQSAGGHSALRLGDWIYHVEHRGDGLLQDRRDRRRAFESAYRGRDNRGIRAFRLDLPREEALELERFLDARRLDRGLRLDELEGWEEDLRWLDRQEDFSHAVLSIPALGLFEPSVSPCESLAPTGFNSSDQARIVQRLGEAREARTRALESALQAQTGVRPALRPLVDATGLVAALELLTRCAPVQPAKLTRLDQGEPIGQDELEKWAVIDDQLRHNILRLIDSRRPDRGLPLMLAWARKQAVQTTIRERAVHVVDGFAEMEAAKGVSMKALNQAWRVQRLRSRSQNVTKARASLLSWNGESGSLEGRLDRLERAAHDLVHEQKGMRHGRPRPTGALAASRALERPVADAFIPWPDDFRLEALRPRRDGVIAQRDALRQNLSADLDYALFTRNCVTEILVALDQTLGTSADSRDRSTLFSTSRRRHALSPLAFIPAVAHHIVSEAAPGSEEARLPSMRESAIHEAEQNASHPIGIRFREANTLTSRFYRPHAEDSAFAFFADDSLAFRPLVGVANLVVGVGASGAGLLASPFDRGSLFLRGIRGVAMSVPEIFFFSIRRGSYPVAPLLEP